MNEVICRRIVSERSGGRCERCGTPRQTTKHHRKKRSHGGPWCPTNVVDVCGSGTTGCHGWIEDHPDEAEIQGWHVRPWQREEDIPVSINGSFAYLLNNGEMRWT